MRFRKYAFSSLMMGFLIVPFVPLQFTSIITAVVWTVSGPYYAIVFVIVGTFFRTDSISIYYGIQRVLGFFLPQDIAALGQWIAIPIMFFGNLATTMLFKRFLRGKLLERLPGELGLRSKSARSPS